MGDANADHGIALVRSVTGSKILFQSVATVPGDNNWLLKIPEDLYHLIQKAVSIAKSSGEEQEGQGFFFKVDTCREQDPPTCPGITRRRISSLPCQNKNPQLEALPWLKSMAVALSC
ncbi:hypothetical protein MLD38_023828 [Melastoma candidum]|uniref:Uncharacterized protein n=1 Tax=Melastoma candidum TaxID=119954 RepID=A0ACB9NQH9_9MYRT|nr:hypothetical protein MLD38_023828 [Melastoma candidum]